MPVENLKMVNGIREFMTHKIVAKEPVQAKL